MAAASSANTTGVAAAANLHNDTEQALAEVELLAQNQRKLNTLTNRMTSILSGFDRRLIKLESTMLPIHRSTQTLIRVQRNVDQVLHSLNKTLGHYDVVQDEEALLRQGPSVRDPQPYLDTITRVKQGLNYLARSDLQSQQKVMVRMNDLIELGSRNVTDMIRDWLSAESDMHGVDVSEYVPRGIALPRLSSATFGAIIPLFSFLKTLPSHPRTHHAPFSSALVAYAEIRAKYMESSLTPLAQRVDAYSKERLSSTAGRAGMTAAWQNEEDDDGGYSRGSAGLSNWINATLDMAENEYSILEELLQSLSPPSSTTTIHSTYARLLRSPLRSFTATLTALQMQIRQSTSTQHTFFAFDVIGALSNASPRWDAVVVANCARQQGAGGGDAGQEQTAVHALSESLVSTRGMAMEIFPTFIASINAMPQQREGEVPSTTINEITYSSLNFMRQLCEYADVAAPLLTSLGAGMWMMGSDRAPVLSLGIDSETQSILSQYLADVLAALLNALEARSRAIRQPSTASIFLLNNISHIKRFLAVDQGVDGCLGTVGRDLTEGALRGAYSAYMEAWQPVVAPLMEEGKAPGASKLGGSSEKAAVKDRFAKFFDGLDDLERLHRAFPITREDAQLKERLRLDVTRMVCPLYARFLARHRTGDFSKNPQKYIRMTEPEVQERIARLY
jgi:exocyst complex protein 7